MPQSVQERWANSKEKDVNRFDSFEKNDYLCTRWWAIVRLVAHRRVFFDAIHSKMWNWVRSPIRNPVFPQSPRQLLYKEKLRILTKLQKTLERKGITFEIIHNLRIWYHIVTMLDYADNCMYPLHSLFRWDLYDAEELLGISHIRQTLFAVSCFHFQLVTICHRFICPVLLINLLSINVSSCLFHCHLCG